VRKSEVGEKIIDKRFTSIKPEIKIRKVVTNKDNDKM
jgi:hypothetical protein